MTVTDDSTLAFDVTDPDLKIGPVQRRQLRALVRSKMFLAGAIILFFWMVCAILGPSFVLHDPFIGDILDKHEPPSGAHWFGTDGLGRDVFSRVIVGSRDILTVAPLAAFLGTALGTALGLVTGYFRGLVDELVMRVVDAFLAVPIVIMGLLALVALGPSKWAVIVVIGIVFAPMIARPVRAAVLSERELEYIQAASLRKESAAYMMFGEILPNVTGTVLVEFTLRLGYAVFAIATLSFLGFGIQPPAPDWGLQIFENYALINAGIWWSALFPALAIASLIIGVNFLFDGLTGVLKQ